MQDSDIPINVTKDNADILIPILLEEFNKSLALGKFPASMKLANITPVFKKDDRTDKNNYRPISILPNLTKIFEKCIYNQLSVLFDKVLFKYQCRFRKGFQCLALSYKIIRTVEKFRLRFSIWCPIDRSLKSFRLSIP